MAEARKEANFSQGWGVATFITALAIAGFVIAGTIKAKTYHNPTDPTAPSSARAEEAPSASHAEAAK